MWWLNSFQFNRYRGSLTQGYSYLANCMIKVIIRAQLPDLALKFSHFLFLNDTIKQKFCLLLNIQLLLYISFLRTLGTLSGLIPHYKLSTFS